MGPTSGLVSIGKAALRIGFEKVEKDRQYGVEMRPDRGAVGCFLVRELVDIRPRMRFPCLHPGLIFGGPALLDLTPKSVQFTRGLPETISEKLYRRVLQLGFCQTFGPLRLVKGGENARWVQSHSLGQVHQHVD